MVAVSGVCAKATEAKRKRQGPRSLGIARFRKSTAMERATTIGRRREKMSELRSDAQGGALCHYGDNAEHFAGTVFYRRLRPGVAHLARQERRARRRFTGAPGKPTPERGREDGAARRHAAEAVRRLQGALRRRPGAQQPVLPRSEERRVRKERRARRSLVR